MNEYLPDSLPVGGDSDGEIDCNRCLKVLLSHALDSSETPVSIGALADSVDPSFSKQTTAGPEILAMVCRVEGCFESSFLSRSEAQPVPAPITARDAEFPLCITN